MIKKYISWQDIQDAVERLALNIEASGKKISSIHGVPRGGLIPAVMLSHRLGVPFLMEDEGEDLDENILVVDDICDTGKTLDCYRDLEHVYTATLHYKNSASYEPTFWWRLASENEWIVYPWERADSKTIQDYKL